MSKENPYASPPSQEPNARPKSTYPWPLAAWSVGTGAVMGAIFIAPILRGFEVPFFYPIAALVGATVGAAYAWLFRRRR